MNINWVAVLLVNSGEECVKEVKKINLCVVRQNENGKWNASGLLSCAHKKNKMEMELERLARL